MSADKTPGADPKDAAPAPRAPRWMRIALVVSLALNLLIVGVVLGAISDGKRGGFRGDISIGPYTGALTREERRSLARSLRQDGERPDRNAMRAQFQQMLSLLRAETFDEQAFTAILQAQGEQVRARQARGKDAFIRMIAEMSTAERQDFANRLEEALRRGPPKR